LPLDVFIAYADHPSSEKQADFTKLKLLPTRHLPHSQQQKIIFGNIT
jgi:hypothetical protein